MEIDKNECKEKNTIQKTCTKKYSKKNKDFKLVIDKSILERLGINKKSDLKMFVRNDMLIIRPKKIKESKKSQLELQKSASQIINKYEDVLKKLAKT